MSDSKKPLTTIAAISGGAAWIYNLLPVRDDVIPHPEYVGPLVWAIIATVLWIGMLREWDSVRMFHLAHRRNPLAVLGVGAVGALVFVVVWFLWGPKTIKGAEPVTSRLIGSIEQVKITEVTSPEGEKVPLIALVMSIRNTDAPAAAEGFTLQIVGQTEARSAPNP